MNAAFSHSKYHIKRQAIALTGKVRFYNPSDQIVAFSEQKMFKLKEDIRIYADESKSQEILTIKARSIIDFSAAYDVIDPVENTHVGVMRRQGVRSILQDKWDILDANEKMIGVLEEDSMGLALIRRVLSSLVPQNYDINVNGRQVADLKQRFNPFRYELDLDFSMDASSGLDRRMGFAAAVSPCRCRRKTILNAKESSF